MGAGVDACMLASVAGDWAPTRSLRKTGIWPAP